MRFNPGSNYLRAGSGCYCIPVLPPPCFFYLFMPRPHFVSFSFQLLPTNFSGAVNTSVMAKFVSLFLLNIYQFRCIGIKVLVYFPRLLFLFIYILFSSFFLLLAIHQSHPIFSFNLPESLEFQVLKIIKWLRYGWLVGWFVGM